MNLPLEIGFGGGGGGGGNSLDDLLRRLGGFGGGGGGGGGGGVRTAVRFGGGGGGGGGSLCMLVLACLVVGVGDRLALAVLLCVLRFTRFRTVFFTRIRIASNQWKG